MNHPTFYLSAHIANALDLRSARTRAREAGVVDYSIEVSRGRGSRSQTWSVICSPDVARFLVAEIEQLRDTPRDLVDRAIADIRAALEQTGAPMTASVEPRAPDVRRIGM